ISPLAVNDTDGMGLHSSGLKRPPLHWFVCRSARALRSASARSYSHNQAFGRNDRDRSQKRSNNVGKRSENRASTKTKETSAARNLSFAAVEQPRKLSGLVGSSNLPPGTPLLFRLRKIGLQVLVAAVDRSHEADAVVFRDCTDPAFLMNITPPRKC